MNPESAFSSGNVNRTESGIPIRNLWYMLLYVWNAFRRKDQWQVEVETAPNLDSLLASVLADMIQQRLRIGLGRNYTPEAAIISGIKGRIDFAESLKRLAFQRGRSFCRYETFNANIPNNQIIRSILARMVQIGDFGDDRERADALRSRLRRLVARMDAIDLIEVRAESIHRQQLLRNDTDYSLMLAICRLMYQRLMPTHDEGQNRLLGLDRDALTLFKIYEQFVATFYKAHLSTKWNIRSQRTIYWDADKPSELLPSMCLDLEMQHRQTGVMIVLDTKFTANILVAGRWGKQSFDPGHLYQMYAYLRSQEHHSDCHSSATGILLYPTVTHRVSEEVRIQGHQIRWETIDLGQPWQDIESDLLEIPSRIVAGFTPAIPCV